MSWLFLRQILKKSYLMVRRTLLAGWSGLFQRRCSTGIPSSPKNLLILSQRRLGDAVLSTPIFPLLRKRFPGCTISVLANPYIREIFEFCPEVDHILEYGKGYGIREILRVIREIRRHPFDLLIDLNTDGSLIFALIAGLSRAGYSVGYDQDGRGVFYDSALPFPEKGDKHMLDMIVQTLSPLGVSPSKEPPRLTVPEPLLQEVRAKLPESGIAQGQVLVGLHSGAVHPTQRWPVEYFAELGDRIIGSGCGRVILCGGDRESDMILRIVDRMKETPLYVRTVSLKHLAALLSELDLLVCNNSGPLHLAAAVGTPTLSFMGPTKPAQWWPLGQGHTVLRRDDLACIGCNMGTCPVKTHACMYGISPTEVFDTIRNRLLQDSKMV
ncbi:MAG: glycosyltransferase family 9 protein [bacterium]